MAALNPASPNHLAPPSLASSPNRFTPPSSIFVSSQHLAPSSHAVAPRLHPPALAVSPPPTSRWIGLFRGAFGAVETSLKHFTLILINGVAKPPSEVVRRGIERWSKFLVATFIGKKMPYFLVRKEIEKVLKCNSFELSSDRDRYFIEVKNYIHRQLLLEGEPIFIAGRIMVLREWCSDLEAQEDHLSSIPLWINLELPRELWTIDGIGYSASLFGVPLGMDQFTAKMSKTKFARVCVEVKANFEFPELIPVDLETRVDAVRAMYKWKPDSCSQCMRFGHTSNHCPDQSSRGVPTVGIERRWKPVVVQKEGMLQENLVGNKDSIEESVVNPVAVTGTQPGEGNTVFLNREDVGDDSRARFNRFEVLAELEEKGSQENRAVEAVNIGNTSAQIASVEGTEQPAAGHTGTGEFLAALDSCLDICSAIVNSAAPPISIVNETEVVNPKELTEKELIDKGAFDPSNPATWPDSIKEADEEIRKVMEWMANPNKIDKPKTKKSDLRVKLIKGNSGLPIRSSSRNNR